MDAISQSLLAPTTFAYLAVWVLYISCWVFKSKGIGKIATIALLLTLLSHTALIILRWLGSYELGVGHAPFSDLFESLVFFGWTLALLYLLVELRTKMRVIGAFALPLAFFTMLYALKLDPSIKPILPALKSNWLIAHVITCFLGYAGFGISFALSLMYLITTKERLPKTPKALLMDDLIYQTVVVGFIMLTAGIVTGAIWANSAWGTYWSWDPKETWSLITWLFYAAMLHSRFMRGFQGRRLALFSIIGFGTVLFTYFGVNFLLKGLHSYATG